MKSIFLTALLVGATTILPGCNSGGRKTDSRSTQSAAPTANPENDEQALMRIEREWGDAMTKHDMVALDRILGDDHSVITKDGSILTKAQEIANYKSETSSNELFDFEPMKVRVFGDTAIVTGGHREKSHNFGNDTSGHYRWTDLFVKRSGRWQAVASELTRVEEARP
jgi:ketosteroid isomerase-like protein